MKFAHLRNYLLGEILSKALPFLLLPYFTRVLGVDGYGELSLYQSSVILLVMIISFASDSAILRYHFYYGRRSVINLVSVAFINSVAFLLLCLLSYFIYSKYATNNILLLAIFTAFMHTLFNMCLSLLQCYKKTTSYMFYQVGFSLLSSLITIVLFTFLNPSVLFRAVSLMASLVLCVFVFVVFSRFKLGLFPFKPNLKKLFLYFKYLYSYSTPIFFNQISFFLRGQFDRIFISGSFSAFSLGIYSAYSQLSLIIPVVIAAIAKALTPYLYGKLKEDRAYLYKINYLLIPMSIIVFILSMLSSIIPDSLFGFILGEKFVKYSYIFPVFVFSSLIQVVYIMMSTVLIYYGKGLGLTYCTVFSSLIHVLSIYFLSELDVFSIAYASVISSITAILVIYLIPFRKLLSEDA